MAQSPSGKQMPADNGDGDALRHSPHADASQNNAPVPGTSEEESAQINKELDEGKLTGNFLYDEMQSHAGNQDLVSTNRRSSRSPQAVPRHDLTFVQDVSLPPRLLRKPTPKSSILKFGSDDGSELARPSITPGPPPNAPTGPRSMQKASSRTSPPALLVSPALLEWPRTAAQHGAKRRSDRLTSRSPSPARVRIKLEEESSPEPDISRRPTRSDWNVRDATENDMPHIDPASMRLRRASRVFTLDPYNEETGWEILCFNQDFGRRKLCSYLRFLNTAQMRAWEESDPKRWEYIKTITLPNVFNCKVIPTDVMRIICNDGGAPASVVAYIEGLEPWTLDTDLDADYYEEISSHCVTVAELSRTTTVSTHATLRHTMAIVWLIRSSPGQFPESGRSETPYFWYAPEDVNRAYWYLSNLRFHADDRETEGTRPSQLPRYIKQGVSAGLSSLHNSVSEGEWAGRFLRKDIVAQKERVSEKQGNRSDRRTKRADRQGEKTGQWRNKAEIRSEDIAAQLLRLRTWSYNTYTFSNPTDETELDRLMDLARLHTKPTSRNLDVYRSACMEVELFVWAKSHPRILDDCFKDTFADFKLLLSWLHARDIAVGDDEEVAGRMEEAVNAVVAADRGGYNGKKAEVKEMAYMADLGMGEVFTGG